MQSRLQIECCFQESWADSWSSNSAPVTLNNTIEVTATNVGGSNTYAESTNARYLTFSCRGEEEESVADKILEKSKETGAKLFEKGKEAGKDLLNYIDEEL